MRYIGQFRNKSGIMRLSCPDGKRANDVWNFSGMELCEKGSYKVYLEKDKFFIVSRKGLLQGVEAEVMEDYKQRKSIALGEKGMDQTRFFELGFDVGTDIAQVGIFDENEFPDYQGENHDFCRKFDTKNDEIKVLSETGVNYCTGVDGCYRAYQHKNEQGKCDAFLIQIGAI